MSVAFLFPGQGAQIPGFLHRLPDHPASRRTLEEAGIIIGRDPLSLDSSPALESTTAVQLALLIAGVATSRVLKALDIFPTYVAGHSVGCFAAAVSAQALSFANAVHLVEVRARAMVEAFPEGLGMAAIIGLDEARVRDLLQRTDESGSRLFVAAINAPQQVVLSGESAFLDRMLVAALSAGAAKAVRLAVNAPSHCKLMAGVAQTLRDELRSITLTAPRAAYLCNSNARAVNDAGNIREDLILGLMNTVLWDDSTVVMRELGARMFLQMPPGTVLSDLAAARFLEVRSMAIDHSNFRSAAGISRAVAARHW